MYEDKPKELKLAVKGMLETVLAHPGDTTARLVLADALEDLLDEPERRGLDINLLRSEEGYWHVGPVYQEGNRASWVLTWVALLPSAAGGKTTEHRLRVASTSLASLVTCANPQYLDKHLPHVPFHASKEFGWRWLCRTCVGRDMKCYTAQNRSAPSILTIFT